MVRHSGKAKLVQVEVRSASCTGVVSGSDRTPGSPDQVKLDGDVLSMEVRDGGQPGDRRVAQGPSQEKTSK